ncbi:NAD-dependent oxidoreductase, partial [Pseudomonas aeruginosa]
MQMTLTIVHIFEKCHILFAGASTYSHSRAKQQEDFFAMSRPLQDKTIIVTGGFGALGSAVGRLLLERGAQVALLDRAEV